MVKKLFGLLVLLMALGLPTVHAGFTLVACVGDSITFGSGSSSEKSSYPSLLKHYLSHRNFHVRNFGVRGATASDFGNVSYWNTTDYAKAMESEASIVIIQLGTNDAKSTIWSRERFVADYSRLIQSFKKMPSQPRVFVSIPPPCYAKSSVYKIQPSVINYDLPALIPTIAKSEDVAVIDVFNALGGRSLNMSYAFIDRSRPLQNPNDGIHPNDIGYLIIARLVASRILSSLDKERQVEESLQE